MTKPAPTAVPKLELAKATPALEKPVAAVVKDTIPTIAKPAMKIEVKPMEKPAAVKDNDSGGYSDEFSFDDDDDEEVPDLPTLKPVAPKEAIKPTTKP